MGWGRQRDRHKTRANRQIRRQHLPVLHTCSVGAGHPLDFSINLDAINCVCLVPSGCSVLIITFRENDDMFSSGMFNLKGGKAFDPIHFC